MGIYDDADMQFLESANGGLVLVFRWIAGPAAVLPNAALNAIISVADAIDSSGQDTFPAGFGQYTVQVDAQILEATSRIITTMTLAGLVVSAPVSVPLALGLAGAAMIGGNLDTLTDPDFWRSIKDNLHEWLGQDNLEGSLLDLEIGINPMTATLFSAASTIQPARRDPNPRFG